MDSFKHKYISFAFKKDINAIHSSYYFRIFQQNYKNDTIIYPLDTNKENYCETKNNTCYFLLKNEYNEFLNKILIYNFEKYIFSYKVFEISYYDYYLGIDLDNLNEGKEIRSFNGLLSLDLKKNKDFILIEVKSNEEEKNLTIVSNFYNQANPQYIDKYSYQLFYLSEKQCQQINLTKNLSINNRILINSTEGEGYISFN